MSLTDVFRSRALCVALGPELLSAVVRSGSRIVAHSEVRVDPDYPGEPWQGALAAFGAYLRQAGVTLRGVPVSVSISTRWCQLAMVPWSDALLHEGSAARYQQAHFAGVYGDAARRWSIVSDDAAYGEPRLACAIEREFIDGLQAIAREHGHPCIAVESILSIAARAIGPGKHEAMAVIEPGRLVLAALAGGRIVAVQSQPCSGAWHAELPRAWQRWLLRTPELGDIAQVALVSLDEHVAPSEVPAPFEAVALPSPLAPGYAAVTMMGC